MVSGLPWEDQSQFAIASAGQDLIIHPRTSLESVIRSTWSRVLHISECSIGVNIPFSSIGGDSILSMKLLSLLRARDLHLEVAQVLSHSTIESQAAFIIAGQAGQFKVSANLSMMAKPFGGVDEVALTWLKSNTLEAISLKWDAVEDAAPMTQFQKELVAETASHPLQRPHVLLRTSYLSSEVNPQKLHRALRQLVKKRSILRTCLLRCDGHFVQVVLKPSASADIVVPAIGLCSNDDDLKLRVSSLNSSSRPIEGALLAPMTQFALFLVPYGGKAVLVQIMHHALYDGWTLGMQESGLWAAYNAADKMDEALVPDVPFATLSRYLALRDSQLDRAFWAAYLHDAPSGAFGAFDGNAQRLAKVERHVSNIDLQTSAQQLGAPASAIVVLAWAYVQEVFLGHEATFGLVLSTRSLPVASIEQMQGACLNYVPFYLPLPAGQAVRQAVKDCQTQLDLVTAHGQQLAYTEIGQAASIPDARSYCRVMLRYQNFALDSEDQARSVASSSGTEDVKMEDTNALDVVFSPVKSGGAIHISLTSRTSEVDEKGLAWLADTLATVLLQISSCNAV